MSKSKKSKAPKIDPRLLTRPRLDALFDRLASGELDEAGLHTAVQALMAEVGERPVLDALVQRMDRTPEAERESLMTLVERLRSPEVIAYLWQQVKKPGALSMEAKTTALVILKQMGEDVDIADPGRYFSPRDFKPGDIQSAEAMVRMGLRGMARHLRGARDPVEVERLMLELNRMPENAVDGEGVLLHLVEEAEAEASDLGADFLHAMVQATPHPKAQKAAEAALARLAARGVKPVTPVILRLAQAKFYAAYMTDPDHPWQQSVSVAWERAPGVIQALVFLLDFGVPWLGSIKDMFATQPLTAEQYYDQFVTRAEKKMGERVYRASLARARATIAAALEANRKNKIPLPKEYGELRHLVERWVLSPPAAALEADTAPDELGDRPLVSTRDKQPLVLDLRGKHGQDVLNLLAQQPTEELVFEDRGIELLEDEAFDAVDFQEEFHSFVDVAEAVHDAYAEALESPPGAPCWKPDWVTDFLASLCPEPDRLDDLTLADEELGWIENTWLTLSDFLVYLEDHAYEIHALSDVQGFHVSEHIREDAWELDDDHGRSRVEDLRQLFAYLAGRGTIPTDVPVLEALAHMLVRPDHLSLLERPRPLGGEIAAWLRNASDEAEAEPLAYNEWWTALVLNRKFRGDRRKFRREARKKRDAEAKLALLDRLENRLVIDADFLEELEVQRPPSLDDYRRAEKWFERESVSDDRAWK